MQRDSFSRALGLCMSIAFALSACSSTQVATPPAPSAASIAATENEALLTLSDDLAKSELLDAGTGDITSLSAVATGDRAVLVWFWTPDCGMSRREGAELEEFARQHQDVIQLIGVGSQGDFASVEEFLAAVEMDTTTMLWERSGNVRGLTRAQGARSMQLYSYDLSEQSDVFSFDDRGRQIALDAAPQPRWAPPKPTNKP